MTFSCFVDAVLLCFACVETLRWNWRIKAMCSTVVCCNSIVLCVSVCADRSGMAASRFLAAAAACGIFFFAVESHKLYYNGCMKVANGVLAADFFFILALMIFLFKFPWKSASKSSFFRLGVEVWFWSCSLCSPCAYFYCVLQRSLC